MPADAENTAAQSRWYRMAKRSREMTAGTELRVWIALVVSVLAIRVYLYSLAPFAIWTDDADSYAEAVVKWLRDGDWETDARRGPIYSLVLAACMKTFGTIDSVMILQHAMSGVAVLLSVLVLRMIWGRIALFPIALSGYAYAVYGLPLSVGHLVRNETILFFFSTLALLCWFLAIHLRQSGWLFLSGVFGALVMVTKSIFGPFAFCVVAGQIFNERKNPPRAILQAALFSVGFAVPYLGVWILNTQSESNRPAEPQSGLLLYGRTAQFTFLEGGIEPEIKAAIRSQVEDYRRLPKLDNNVILKRTVVPTIRRIVDKRGGTPTDVDRICRALAFEAITTHKFAYLRQVLGDAWGLLSSGASKIRVPNDDQMLSMEEMLLKPLGWENLTDPVATLPKVQARTGRKNFEIYRNWTYTAWLFRLSPVLLTALLLPWMVWRTSGDLRVWWIGGALLFYFTVVLLCTVGRPMDRYVLPVAPVMFWTLGSGAVLAWQELTRRVLSREMSPRESRNPTTAPDEYLRT